MKHVARISFFCFLILGLWGCNFIATKQHLRHIEQYTEIRGKIITTSTSHKPLIVAIWSTEDPENRILRSWVMYGQGTFRFMVRSPGTYTIMAFEDLNGNMAYDKAEQAGVYPPKGGIYVEPEQVVNDIEIAVDVGAVTLNNIHVAVPYSETTIQFDEIGFSIGEVMSLESPRFSRKNASLGLWEPSRFVQDAGAGIYFLKEFNSEKIPVLFVHGAEGTPKDWIPIISRLDKSRFQPWVFFYPSGARLDNVGEVMYRIVNRLQLKHKFQQMHVVAHSMGGLVSRRFLKELSFRNSPIHIPLFVSISTPWAGHEAAEMGVNHAPVVVPSWIDMVPASPFLQSLWETPLPSGTVYHLLFSYKGKSKFFMDRNNDGSVTLKSMLHPRAQAGADRLYGFGETHVSIISSQEVSLLINSLLVKYSHR